MASVWLHERGEIAPVKLMGYLKESAAKRVFCHMLENWQGQKRMVFDYEALLYETPKQYRENKPSGSIFIEFCSPPTAPEKGQPLKTAHERKEHD